MGHSSHLGIDPKRSGAIDLSFLDLQLCLCGSGNRHVSKRLFAGRCYPLLWRAIRAVNIDFGTMETRDARTRKGKETFVTLR